MKHSFTFFLFVFISVVSCKEDYDVVPYVVNIEDATGYDYSSTNLIFSVSNTKKIYFSKGNLQYQASTNTWRFAEHQYDCIGGNQNYFSSTSEDWIDIFCYGTSGYNGKYPYMYNYDYFAGDISGTNYDWGVYNKISNGGNVAGLWRTLTYDEWKYLLYSRKNANDLRAQVEIEDDDIDPLGRDGWVLLPDNWVKPEKISFSSDKKNKYNIREWKKMEASGAVFLPVKTTVYGEYWTGSFDSDPYESCPYSILFSDYSYFGIDHSGGSRWLAVRLVCDANKCDALKLVKK